MCVPGCPSWSSKAGPSGPKTNERRQGLQPVGRRGGQGHGRRGPARSQQAHGRPPCKVAGFSCCVTRPCGRQGKLREGPPPSWPVSDLLRLLTVFRPCSSEWGRLLVKREKQEAELFLGRTGVTDETLGCAPAGPRAWMTRIPVCFPVAPAWLLLLQAVTDTKLQTMESWEDLENDLVPSNVTLSDHCVPHPEDIKTDHDDNQC